MKYITIKLTTGQLDTLTTALNEAETFANVHLANEGGLKQEDYNPDWIDENGWGNRRCRQDRAAFEMLKTKLVKIQQENT